MATQSDDRPVLSHIDQLVKEEQGLYRQSELADKDRTRLEELKVELDQCWDLLRQRQALREFGEDPDKAKVRPANIVENYEQSGPQRFRAGLNSSSEERSMAQRLCRAYGAEEWDAKSEKAKRLQWSPLPRYGANQHLQPAVQSDLLTSMESSGSQATGPADHGTDACTFAASEDSAQ